MKRILSTVLLLAILVTAVAPITVTASQDTPVKLSTVALAQGQNSGDPPDLTLSSGDIGFTPSEPVVGETVTITATIHNIGDANAKDVLVYFSANSTSIGEDGIKVIPKGQSRSVGIDWIPGVAGNYNILVVVDPLDTIDEGVNEGNNQASTTITVGGAPPEVVHDVAVTSVTASPTEVTAGEVVTITVSVENQGEATETFDVTSYYDSVAIGTQTVADLIAGASDMLTFSWDTTGVADGTYTISAEASTVPGETDTADNTFEDGTVTVSAPGAPPTTTHELFIEIDYMVNHAPTQAVLDYIEWYYMGNNPSGELINVTFYVDDEVLYDPSVTQQEFWAIEVTYNDLGDDAYGTGDPVFGTAGVYSSKWKWVLFGTVDGEWGAMGYCYVVWQQVGRREGDMLAGNYMFVADEAADAWSVNNGIEPHGAEAVILMHEMGHSIGIGIIEWHPLWGWHEVYDSDSGSVMSYLSTANAELYGAWYYSDKYWATRNLDYYKKEP